MADHLEHARHIKRAQFYILFLYLKLPNNSTASSVNTFNEQHPKSTSALSFWELVEPSLTLAVWTLSRLLVLTLRELPSLPWSSTLIWFGVLINVSAPDALLKILTPTLVFLISIHLWLDIFPCADGTAFYLLTIATTHMQNHTIAYYGMSIHRPSVPNGSKRGIQVKPSVHQHALGRRSTSGRVNTASPLAGSRSAEVWSDVNVSHWLLLCLPMTIFHITRMADPHSLYRTPGKFEMMFIKWGRSNLVERADTNLEEIQHSAVLAC